MGPSELVSFGDLVLPSASYFSGILSYGLIAVGTNNRVNERTGGCTNTNIVYGHSE